MNIIEQLLYIGGNRPSVSAPDLLGPVNGAR